MAKNLSPEAQRIAEQFLAERARMRSAMIREAGFQPPFEPPPPAPPVLSEKEVSKEHDDEPKYVSNPGSGGYR